MTFEEIKKIVETSPEYDFLKTDKHLGGNIILLGLGGSYAYGTNIESSDIDVRGITMNDKSSLLRVGIEKADFEQFDDSNTDTVIYSFNKMIRLLLECNPNTIEILGNPKDEYLLMTDLGEELLDMAPYFLSKRCEKTFTGYANQQLYRLKQKSLCAMTPEEYNEHIVKVLKSMTERFEKQGLKKVHLPLWLFAAKSIFLLEMALIFQQKSLKYILMNFIQQLIIIIEFQKGTKRLLNMGKLINTLCIFFVFI